MRNYYFAYFEPSFSTLEISVSPIFGDPDIYAAFGQQRVTFENAKFISNSASGSDSIVISHADMLASSNCSNTQRTPCVLSIMIFGFRASLYSITVSANTRSVTLQDGVPYKDSMLPYTAQYFSFRLVGQATL